MVTGSHPMAVDPVTGELAELAEMSDGMQVVDVAWHWAPRRRRTLGAVEPNASDTPSVAWLIAVPA